MEYTVNLGCWGSIFAVPTDVVDKYIKIAGSAQLKVLLYILRHSGGEFSAEDIAAALNMGAFDVKDCVEFWVSFGVIAINNGDITPAPAVSPVQSPVPAASAVQSPAPAASPVQSPAPAAAPVQSPVPAAALIDKTDKERSDTVAARPLRPDPIYIAKRVSEDEEIANLYTEAQYILGRPISPNENAGLLMLHDNDGLPCEVILMLLTYGTSNHKGMRQIEAMGAAWAKEGILTLEQADEKIRRLDESKEAYRKIQTLLGLEYRKPSQKEEEMYSRWLHEWRLSDDLIKEAYDLCVNAKGKYIPNYLNTILTRWHESGINTVESARAERAKFVGAQTPRQSSFDINDLNNLSMFND
ncbi:MAG: DnaD domain protein [Clostridia bacterium]|nr:DnaD domain protein [Clostridia bacterium]